MTVTAGRPFVGVSLRQGNDNAKDGGRVLGVDGRRAGQFERKGQYNHHLSQAGARLLAEL